MPGYSLGLKQSSYLMELYYKLNQLTLRSSWCQFATAASWWVVLTLESLSGKNPDRCFPVADVTLPVPVPDWPAPRPPRSSGGELGAGELPICLKNTMNFNVTVRIFYKKILWTCFSLRFFYKPFRNSSIRITYLIPEVLSMDQLKSGKCVCA